MTPSLSELADFHVLAFRKYRDSGSVRAEAMGATAAWVRGGRSAPVTFREDKPVTKALAKAELWAAADVDTGDVPLESFCAALGVPYAAPIADNPVWARAVEVTLRWVTADPSEQREPPLRLPKRNSDGTVATAEEVYRAAMAATPTRHWGPEERHALRRRSEVEALQSARLAAIVADTLRTSRETG